MFIGQDGVAPHLAFEAIAHLDGLRTSVRKGMLGLGECDGTIVFGGAHLNMFDFRTVADYYGIDDGLPTADQSDPDLTT